MTAPGASRRSRFLAIAALAVVLLVAGVLSGFASGSPDGMEKVAQEKGFSAQGRESAALGPFDGYAVAGDDSRLGTGAAGVAGAGMVLLIAGGAAWAIRRRPSEPSAEKQASATAARHR